MVLTCIAAVSSRGWRHLFLEYIDTEELQRGRSGYLPLLCCPGGNPFLHFPASACDRMSDTGCLRCCQGGGLKGPSQVTWGISSSSIRPGSIILSFWDAKSTERFMSSVLGNGGHCTAFAWRDVRRGVTLKFCHPL